MSLSNVMKKPWRITHVNLTFGVMGKKFKLKSHRSEFLEKTLKALKFSSPTYKKKKKKKRSTCYEYGMREKLAFRNLQYFLNLTIDYKMFFVVKHYDKIFQICEKSLQYHTCTTHLPTKKIASGWVTEMGVSTLYGVNIPCVGGDGVGRILWCCWLVEYIVFITWFHLVCG